MDELGSSDKLLVVLDCDSVVEESVMVAVKVESIGAVEGSEECVCVFLLVVRVSDAKRLVETEEVDSLPDIADDDVMILEGILEGSMELGRRVV